MSELGFPFPEEEPRTSIATKVRRAVDQQELQQNRRFWDKFVLPGVFTGAVLLTAWLLWVRDVTNSHGIIIDQIRSEIAAKAIEMAELRKGMHEHGGIKEVGIESIISLSTELSILERRVASLERGLMGDAGATKRTR